jgi:hypothetical protein
MKAIIRISSSEAGQTVVSGHQFAFRGGNARARRINGMDNG